MFTFYQYNTIHITVVLCLDIYVYVCHKQVYCLNVWTHWAGFWQTAATTGRLMFTAPLAATGWRQMCMARMVWLKLHWFDFLSIYCGFVQQVLQQIESMEFQPIHYAANDDCQHSALGCVYSTLVVWVWAPSSCGHHWHELIYLYKLEAIQRWLAICRMWPWTLTYQKFLLCISS